MQEMRERKVKVAHHRSGLMLWAWVFVLGVIVIRGDSRSLRPPRPKMFRACAEYLFSLLFLRSRTFASFLFKTV